MSFGDVLASKMLAKPAQPDAAILGSNSYIPPSEVKGLIGTDAGKGWNTIPHAEAQRYLDAGLNSAELTAALDNWQSTPDKIDDLIALTYQKDPVEAASVVGQQVARRPGGSEVTPDASWFSYDKYWNSIVGGRAVYKGDPGYEAAFGDTWDAAHSLGLDTDEAATASARWNSEMTAGAQSARNDKDDDFLGGFGGILLGAGLTALGLPAWAVGGITSASTGGNPILGAAAGWAGGAIGSALPAGTSPIISGAARGAVGGLLASGGDINSAITGAVTGGVGGAVGSPTGNTIVDSVIGGAARYATGTATKNILGGNVSGFGSVISSPSTYGTTGTTKKITNQNLKLGV